MLPLLPDGRRLSAALVSRIVAHASVTSHPYNAAHARAAFPASRASGGDCTGDPVERQDAVDRCVALDRGQRHRIVAGGGFVDRKHRAAAKGMIGKAPPSMQARLHGSYTIPRSSPAAVGELP
jgi:hypothetical protein